ncbi:MULTISPECIES: transcriptional regulator [Parabacteroides]|uniref:transcriptional regulator n=1 Tax=Parabacteroides TaxID=375288 RepID=UPI001D130204|nr:MULTISPECIES: transcriptional regulator [Parabacteroides]MCC2203407.1 transcriptional regulator [Parabacteroides distasonis]MCM0727389.1 transcriptional regulator [Parabacteroides sp. Y3-G-102]
MPTHILRNDRPKGGLTQVGKRHDLKAVRWYVLTLPTAAGGRRDRISPSKGLDVELSRRERRGETLFEYFAPSYVEVRKVGGKLVNTRRPLLFNYVFIRSSVEEIFRMKQALPLYNFLPRVSSGSTTYFPHLLDQEMANLRWVAEAYSNELPVYVPESTRLLKGDRVRITSGYFTGMEAEVVIQPGGGHKEVMARILDCMWVPLFEVKAGEYELIELNAKSKHVYTHLDNDRLSEGLHEALGRYHASGSVCEEDRRLAGEVLRGYASLRAETDVMRCKLCALLLPTYKLSGDEEAFVRLHDTMRGLLPVVKAPQSRALLLVTLYGCTDNALYRRMAHELVDPWQVDPSPKKSKLSLIRRLGDYDRWLGHESVDS